VAAGSRLQFLSALLPVLLFLAWGLAQNHLALIDDGITIATAQMRFLDLFRATLSTGSERFVPLYFVYHWVLLRLLPRSAWSLTLGNGLCLGAIAVFVLLLVRRRAGVPAGIVAAWLVVLNSAAADNAFSLSKPEPKQLVCWLAALFLIDRALAGTTGRWRFLAPPLMLAATTGAVFVKETGVFLALPCIMLAVHVLTRPGRSRAERGAGLALALAGALPPLLAAGLILSRGFGGANSYGRRHFMSQTPPPLAQLPSLDWQVSLLFAAGLAGGVYIIWRRWRTAEGWFAAMLASQLLASLLLFSRKIEPKIYYLFPAVAFAVILAVWAGTLATGATRRREWWWWAAGSALVWGATHAFVVAQALAGWGWLHDQVVRHVLHERPARVAFVNPVNPENVYEAELLWTLLHGLPIRVGLLGGASKNRPPVVRMINPSELQAGDLLVEEFGAAGNRDFPLRDFQNENPVSPPPDSRRSLPMVPFETTRLLTARFPAFRQAPVIGLPERFITWRISRVTAPANFGFGDVDWDGWMGATAQLFVNARRVTRLKLRFTTFRGGRGGAERLLIDAGGRRVADCPALPVGETECLVPLTTLPVQPDSEGWMSLRLSADRTCSPADYGIPDSRQLSFKLSPTSRP
jgi:hypothetical protein